MTTSNRAVFPHGTFIEFNQTKSDCGKFVKVSSKILKSFLENFEKIPRKI